MRFLPKALTGLAMLGLTTGAAFAQAPSSPARTPSTMAPTTAPATPNTSPSTRATRTAAAVHPVPAGLSCSGDTVVWVNTRSHKYRTPGQSLYGATKVGKYVCKSEAEKEGDKPIKG